MIFDQTSVRLWILGQGPDRQEIQNVGCRAWPAKLGGPKGLRHGAATALRLTRPWSEGPHLHGAPLAAKSGRAHVGEYALAMCLAVPLCGHWTGAYFAVFPGGPPPQY